ncbi:hypothetical protein [Trichloromonas acetexigens]|uniref:Uncharacterized protein n=1 Tax=Trichloromonas acetexigens TaxID=38815 RepID=A0A550JBB0_9BACT|nr:hypothetical protein [Desulfuromonas acetexigens]TRO80504.1 hypothetical protein FL622_10410 [Desulfuromonas acetexigens]
MLRPGSFGVERNKGRSMLRPYAWPESVSLSVTGVLIVTGRSMLRPYDKSLFANGFYASFAASYISPALRRLRFL